MIKRNDFIKFLNIADTFLDTGSTALVLDAIGENYGLSAITGLGRLDGYPLIIIANNPQMTSKEIPSTALLTF